MQGRTRATAARNVLDDCRWALNQHTPDLQGEAFRVSWVALVALLRAVGHVLKEVDAEQGDAHLKAAICDHWARLKVGEAAREPAIFWGFIKQERNMVLKQYSLGAKRIAHLPPSGPIDPNKGQISLYVELSGGKSKPGRTGRIEFSSPVEVTSEITGGPFKGQNERDVVEKAIEWWQASLDEIDRVAQVARAKSSPTA